MNDHVLAHPDGRIYGPMTSAAAVHWSLEPAFAQPQDTAENDHRRRFTIRPLLPTDRPIERRIHTS
jgi:hypothetical protein